MEFDSIDNLPIWNYNKILESGNFEKYGVKSKKIWEQIEKEFFYKIGYNEKYFEILRIRANIVLNKAKYYKTKNSSLKTLISIEKAKLEQILGEKKASEFSLMVASLSKFMGFKIDVKTTTVSEFYSYLKIANNG